MNYERCSRKENRKQEGRMRKGKKRGWWEDNDSGGEGGKGFFREEWREKNCNPGERGMS